MTTNFEHESEAAITQALEVRPEPVIPADFAVRVVQSLPARPVVRRQSGIGRTVGFVAAAVLTAGVFAVAPHTTASFSSLNFDLELLLLAELGALGYWLTARREA